MTHPSRSLILTAALCAAGASSAADPFPDRLTVRGKLGRGADGGGGKDTVVNLMYRVTDASSVMTFHAEGHCGVSVVGQDREFEDVLGKVPLGNTVEHFFDEDNWLEVTICTAPEFCFNPNNPDLSTCVAPVALFAPLSAVAFAHRAKDADHLGGLPASDYFSTSMLFDGDVTGTFDDLQLQPGVVGSAELADGAVTAPKLGPMAITGAAIADGTVGTADLADGAVTAAKLAPMAITGAAIADGTITTLDLATGAVTAADIAANAVTGAAIADSAITTLDLAAGAVTIADIAANSVLGTAIIDGTITTADLATGAVTSSDIAASAVTGGAIADLSVTNADIANATLAFAKLGANGATAVGQAIRWTGSAWAAATTATQTTNVLSPLSGLAPLVSATATCAAGFRLMGGGCFRAGAGTCGGGDHLLMVSAPSGGGTSTTSWFCQMRCLAAATLQVGAAAICQR